MSGLDICISFDTTGSMFPALLSVRRNVESLVEFLYVNNAETRIAVVAQGCYSDRDSAYILKGTNFCDRANKNYVVDFVRNVGKTDGHDWKEAYEYLFNQVAKLDWQSEEKLFIFISDAEPHEIGYCNSCKYIVTHSWREELKRLQAMDVQMYSVRALTSNASAFYNTIEDTFNTRIVPLTQFDNLFDIIKLLHSNKNGNIESTINELEKSSRINLGLAKAIDAILGKTSKESIYERKVARKYDIDLDSTDLEIVTDGRFQILHVDKNRSIRDFVESTGAKFKVGKGFYQLTKSELVQERKEIVLEHKESCVLYSGSKARLLMGLPFGKRGVLSTRNIPKGYNTFVQSTSWNRKLISGTRFLYEVDLSR